MFIDIHTHSEKSNRPGVVAVRNVFIQDADDLPAGIGYFSVGLHPWDTEKLTVFPDLPGGLFDRPGLLAVGECGLDRLRGANQDTQTSLFIHQIQLAGLYRKPLIIHCVQAWQEMVALKKGAQTAVPWVIHGFRGKPELAAELVNHGFYLSFGEQLLNPASTASRSFLTIPTGRVFLETDDSRHPIEEIYQSAAQIKSLSLIGLQACLVQNFKTVFGTNGTSRMASTDAASDWQ